MSSLEETTIAKTNEEPEKTTEPVSEPTPVENKGDAPSDTNDGNE